MVASDAPRLVELMNWSVRCGTVASIGIPAMDDETLRKQRSQLIRLRDVVVTDGYIPNNARTATFSWPLQPRSDRCR